ncbi:hypothetical protein [Streptomyces palmae]|uniref:Uncharacterized protein n=1 Tax=Streptomyces palmae TaxID=1701085 RepID=A0A4Z0HCM6_9ACTN|nr:hypothetical protein [Streptomyces palmae]TGB17585.1 hypothetical protein E4099_03265 [Streptomyces palmae]
MAAAGLPVAAGEVFHFTGGHDFWRDTASFRDACQGLLDRAPRSALSSAAVRAQAGDDLSSRRTRPRRVTSRTAR